MHFTGGNNQYRFIIIYLGILPTGIEQYKKRHPMLLARIYIFSSGSPIKDFGDDGPTIMRRYTFERWGKVDNKFGS